MQGRVALGARAGARVIQIGREPDAPWVTSRGPRQAHLEGFDLHADIAVAADDRAGLERLARYVLRPPVAQDRLALTPEGQVLLTLKAEWADGTTHLLFEPIEFLEKLAALTPRPRIQLARLPWDSGPACAGAGPSRRSRLRRVNDREASARWGRARRGRLRPHSGTGRRVASRGEPAARPREAPRLGLGGSLPVLPAWLGSRKVYTAFALFPHPLIIPPP